ncbi:VOC family protein [Nitratireductor rhodophyticola]|uniref:VOC family protein n=1 Tax=Nitratireductor rhodophyticola TaxID=2854036 RepID=UPI00300AAC6C
MTQHGYFHWNELMTRDAEKIKSFYADTVGWTFDDMDMGGGQTYWIAMVGEAPVAGIFTMAGPDFEGVPEHWMPYLAVDGVDGALDKAKGKGAEVLREPFDVPGVGRIAILREPGGATIGWMTPANPA